MIKDDKIIIIIIIIIKHQEKHRFSNKIDLSLKSSFSSCHLGDLGKKYLTSLIVTLLILKGSDITVFCKGITVFCCMKCDGIHKALETNNW